MSNYEMPIYVVKQKSANIEIREYESFYTSSVEEPDLRGFRGFGILFSYISGSNANQQKISMTIPVINTFDKEQSMEFVIPKKLNSNIPHPIDQQLKIKKYDARLVASIRFSGLTSKKRIMYHLDKLTTWIRQQNFDIVGPVQLARYNPPFSIPWLRRNEIMVSVAKQPINED